MLDRSRPNGVSTIEQLRHVATSSPSSRQINFTPASDQYLVKFSEQGSQLDLCDDVVRCPTLLAMDGNLYCRRIVTDYRGPNLSNHGVSASEHVRTGSSSVLRGSRV